MTDKAMFGRGGKVVDLKGNTVAQAPDAVEPEPEFTSPEMETWWLPAPVAAWVDACALSFGIPKAMAVAAAMTAAAAVTQGKCTVQIRPGWTEPTSLYWLVFSPTGSRKSALLRAAVAPIRALQRQLEEELGHVIEQRTRERARIEGLIRKQLNKQKAEDSWTESAQEQRMLLNKLYRDLDATEVPKIPRWLYDDINPTVVPRKLRHNQEADGIARVAVLDAEGTFLANLLGRHSGSVNVDPLLKGYGGEPIDMVRAVHGSADTADTHIDAAHISLCLLVQPHYLDEMRRKPELISNGFLGRCLMTHLEHSVTATPWESPPVPDQVQHDYARWLATLAALPAGTVYAMPDDIQGELKAFHERLEADRLENRGATGWTVRTLGRICRLIALTELATVTPSQCHRGVGALACTGVTSKLTYLISTVYTRALLTARALEPTSDPLARLSRRTLARLRQCDSAKTPQIVTLRDVTRWLHVGKDKALEVCDSLVSDGFLEQQAPTVRANKTLTISYRVLTLEASKPDQVKPVLLPVSDPLEQAPEMSTYIGDDDFSDLVDP